MAGREFVEDTVGESGLECVRYESFDPGDTTMLPQLTNIKNSDAETMLIFDASMLGVIASGEAKDLQMDIPIFVVPPMAIPPYLFERPGDMEGDYTVSTAADVVDELPDGHPMKQKVIDFQEAYFAKYGEHPAHDEPIGYDMGYIVEEALKIADPDTCDLETARDQVRDAMEQLHVQGVYWEYEFTPDNHDGTELHPLLALLQIQDDWPAFVDWFDAEDVQEWLGC
jgi:branched-chain amino acid transport system substrate-binding protein